MRKCFGARRPISLYSWADSADGSRTLIVLVVRKQNFSFVDCCSEGPVSEQALVRKGHTLEYSSISAETTSPPLNTLRRHVKTKCPRLLTAKKDKKRHKDAFSLSLRDDADRGQRLAPEVRLLNLSMRVSVMIR